MGRLAGKTALITAAGQGIGRATADAYLREGATVIAVDINAETLKDFGGISQVADITDPDTVRALAAKFPDVDVLYNCAGTVHAGTILDCDEDAWQFSINLNVTAMYRLIRAFLPSMLSRGGGSI